MRRVLAGMILLLLIAGLGALAYVAVISQPPATIEEAVALTLRRAGAPSSGVQVEQAGCVPSPETCLTYIADVHLPGERTAGRLACAAPWSGCTLTMAEFGLRAAPVPDVGLPHPLVATLSDLVRQAAEWVRGPPR